MISNEKLEKVLKYLAETDESYAHARHVVDSMKYKIKVIESQGFMKATGTMAERGAASKTTKEYIEAIEEMDNANLDKEIMGAKRETGRLIIEIWRSENANRRQGNI